MPESAKNQKTNTWKSESEEKYGTIDHSKGEKRFNDKQSTVLCSRIRVQMQFDKNVASIGLQNDRILVDNRDNNWNYSSRLLPKNRKQV